MDAVTLSITLAVVSLLLIVAFYMGFREGLNVNEEQQYAEEIAAYEAAKAHKRGEQHGARATIIAFPAKRAN